jgi:hypothetical protein
MKKTLLAVCIASLLPLTASAVEGRVSGFGTIGAATTDSTTGYDRGLDKSNPEWVNDTKAGIQADVKINNQLSLTGQVVAKQSTTDDDRMAVQGEWLFGSYAVSDSTKVRAGKLRLPLFMMSEQLDVGKAYTLAKLPLEMYGQAPTNGYVGADVLKSFEVGEDGELTIQPYVGMTRFDGRVAGMTTDGMTKYGTFEADSIRGLNVMFDYNEMLRLRAGYMMTNLDYKGGLTGSLPPMMGGYPLDMAAGGGVHNVDASFGSLGAQLRLGGTTITGEYGQRRIKSAFFADTDGRYVAVDHKLGAFTPYVSYAVISSDAAKSVGGQAAPNLDQSTKAAGVVYAVNGNSNIKAEASQVSVGSANNSNEFFNNGMAVAGKDINVYRLNYNLMF